MSWANKTLLVAHHYPDTKRNQTIGDEFGEVYPCFLEKYLVKAPMCIVTVTIRWMAVRVLGARLWARINDVEWNTCKPL